MLPCRPQERETARLRAMQEKAQDKAAEMDALRAKRQGLPGVHQGVVQDADSSLGFEAAVFRGMELTMQFRGLY